MIEPSRRGFLGLFLAGAASAALAPSVVKAANLMALPNRRILGEFLSRDDLLLSYDVVDLQSKLIVHRTVSQILAEPLRYQAYLPNYQKKEPNLTPLELKAIQAGPPKRRFIMT